MFCFKCGKQLPEGVKFCPYCGEKQPEYTVPMVSQESKSVREEGAFAVQEPKPSKSPKPSEPLQTCQESEPSKPPKPSEPLQARQESEPSKSPKPSEPLQTCQESEPLKPPKPSEPLQTRQEPKPLNKGNKLVVVLLGIIVVLLILLAFALGRRKMPVTNYPDYSGNNFDSGEGTDTAPETAFLSPLAYFGLTEGDLDENVSHHDNQNTQYTYQILTFEYQDDKDFLEEYVSLLLENYPFIQLDCKTVLGDSFSRCYYLAYTGTGPVSSLSKGSQLILTLRINSSDNFTEVSWQFVDELEPVDDGSRAGYTPSLFSESGNT